MQTKIFRILPINQRIYFKKVIVKSHAPWTMLKKSLFS